jgi:segregation and condensation protein B
MTPEGVSRSAREGLKPALEALIFASDEPLPVSEAVEVLEAREEEVLAAIEELRADYEARSSGLRLEQVAGGLRLGTRPEVAPFLHKLARLRHKRRLSVAALETLAVIAYRQPITGPEIQEIRGVNPEGALKTLLERRLVRVSGRKKVVGRPLLYSTTRDFLMHFGLNTLDDLPAMEEFEKILARTAELEGAPSPLPFDEEDGTNLTERLAAAGTGPAGEE